jgi:membrane fusion protein, multidrug efflux system
VRAPIDGRISDRKVDAGNLVSGGQVGASLLTTIVSLHPIHFVFNVSEPDYVRYSRLARTANDRRRACPATPFRSVWQRRKNGHETDR